MAFTPNTFTPSRKSRTFQVLNPNAFITPFYFLAASATGYAGNVVKYHATQESACQIATSGLLKHQLAGFLTQDVKDLDSGPVRGYRSLYNSVANLNEVVGVLQSNGPVETTQYLGTPAVGDRLCINDSSGSLTVYTALMAGDPIAVVEATVESIPAGIEPQQLVGAGGTRSLIRLRVFGF